MWKILLLTFSVAAALQEHWQRQPQQLSPSLMEPFVQHPSLRALELDKRPRRKLKRKHKHLFPTTNDDDYFLNVFHTLARIACETEVVPRKELFETYSAALYIHNHFPDCKRIADLAGGHGLLSWFLLVLDPTRSAIVVDCCMPSSAERIQTAMQHEFPNLDWTYVVSDLKGVQAHPSTLLVSVHACASLSDRLVDLAIQGGAPLALAPCCHTIRTNKGYRPPLYSSLTTDSVSRMVNAISNNNKDSRSMADVLDEIRCRTLEQEGYCVQEAALPSMFTPKNRLILANPTTNTTTTQQRQHQINTIYQQQDFFLFEQRSKKKPTLPQLSIPLKDDLESIAYCKSISGQAQAEARLLQTIPKHYSPTLDVSIFVPPHRTAEEVRTHIEDLANQCCSSDHPLQIEVELVGVMHVQQSSGRSSQTYRVKYQAPEGTRIQQARVPKQLAKKIHQRVVASLNSNTENDFCDLEVR